MVVKNRCGGNTSNFQVVADNRVGPIVIPSNSGAISGNGAGSASGMGTTDPWANFSY